MKKEYEIDYEFFYNDKYFVLKALAESQVEGIDKEKYVALSQSDIAIKLNKSAGMVNKYIKELLENGYIELYTKKKGKYKITGKGYSLLNNIKMNGYGNKY